MMGRPSLVEAGVGLPGSLDPGPQEEESLLLGPGETLQPPGIIGEEKATRVKTEGQADANNRHTARINGKSDDLSLESPQPQPHARAVQAAHADASCRKDESSAFWGQWREIQRGLVKDVEQQLQRQDRLITVFLKEAGEGRLRQAAEDHATDPPHSARLTESASVSLPEAPLPPKSPSPSQQLRLPVPKPPVESPPLFAEETKENAGIAGCATKSDGSVGVDEYIAAAGSPRRERSKSPTQSKGRSPVAPHQCECGNIFMSDARFCRKCGREREAADLYQDENTVAENTGVESLQSLQSQQPSGGRRARRFSMNPPAKAQLSRMSARLSRQDSSLEENAKYTAWLNQHQDQVQNVMNRVEREGGGMAYWVEAFAEKYGVIAREPERVGCLGDFIATSRFTSVVTTVILLDSLFTAYTTDYVMRKQVSSTPTSMNIIEAVLVLLYVLEVSLRISVHRLYFFWNNQMGWNIFDFLLTVQGVIDVILTFSPTGDDGAQVRFMRLARLMKLGKLLRLFRAIKFFRDLRVMAHAIAYSVSSMFWAFVMLALILYVAALFFVQMMHGYLDECRNESSSCYLEPTKRDAVMERWGSLGRAILTLYQSASSGVDWEVVYNIVEDSGTASSIGFIFFIWFFNFAVVNILSGIFIEKALDASIPDREQLALEQRREEETDAAHLTDLITAMDSNGNGMITLAEFLVQAHDVYASAYLRTLGINIDDASMFFGLLQKVIGTEGLPIEEFVGKLVKMKGTAKSLDLQSLAFEVSIVRRTLNQIAAVLESDYLFNAPAIEDVDIPDQPFKQMSTMSARP